MRLEYFELLDRVEELRLAEGTIRAYGRIPAKSPVFEGHFPGHPLVPGVLLIEIMAQTSGWLLIARLNFERMVYLAGVKQAKLRNFVGPNAELAIEANIVHDGSGYSVTEGSISKAGESVADAELTFRVLPFPTPDFGDMMRKRARDLGLMVGA